MLFESFFYLAATTGGGGTAFDSFGPFSEMFVRPFVRSSVRLFVRSFVRSSVRSSVHQNTVPLTLIIIEKTRIYGTLLLVQTPFLYTQDFPFDWEEFCYVRTSSEK